MSVDRIHTTEAVAWECAARRQWTGGGNDPADCDWPVCGCDPQAVKVMVALTEMGLLSEKAWRD